MKAERAIGEMRGAVLERLSIHGVSLAELARIAEALCADGRHDLAGDIIHILYYCAERQTSRSNVVTFPGLKVGVELPARSA